jgi:hypothetical protein
MDDQSVQHVRRGIGRGLSTNCVVEQEVPEQIEVLLRRLSVQDSKATAADRTLPSIDRENATQTDNTVRHELNRYLDRLGAYLPDWLCRTVKWLRRPDRFIARIVVSSVLVLGGLFSFLPVLGLWMLPLGLIVISQDLIFLQRPLVRVFKWTEHQFRNLRARFKRKDGGGKLAHSGEPKEKEGTGKIAFPR